MVLLPFAVLLLVYILPSRTHCLGGTSTVAIHHSSGTICAIVAAVGPRTILCFDGNRTFPIHPNISFDSISSVRDSICGLRSDGLSSALLCWKPNATDAPVRRVLQSPTNSSSSSPTKKLPPLSNKPNTSLFTYTIIGSVGALVGICSILFHFLNGICTFRKAQNLVLPIPSTAALPNGPHGSLALLPLQVQGSGTTQQQRRPPQQERVEMISFQELVEATDQFSVRNRIGIGSFGVVYRGILRCGREVAIKRSERTNPTQLEKEAAFHSELTLLSRLHHKHLVGLVGFCEEGDEMLLVYDYMKNGSLHSHLHNNKEPSNSSGSNGNLFNSWKMRIRVLLDASRGIDYLHNYVVPPVIHRDIKSSNILLDGNWEAHLSDFGLSHFDRGFGDAAAGDGSSLHKVVGTVGYMDPEYYGLLCVSSVKSDVYGLGVVILEVLTGKRAMFREEGEEEHISLVDYAVGRINKGEVIAVLDERMPMPSQREVEALKRVANTAVHCVRKKGMNRPTLSQVVFHLDCALLLCEDSHAGELLH